MKNSKRQYIKKIRFLLPFHSAKEKKFLSDLDEFLTEYLILHPEATETDLANEFGQPQAIVSEYLSNLSGDVLTQQLKFTQYIRKTCILIILIILVGFGVWNYCLYNSYKLVVDNIPVSEETIIEYGDGES